MTAQEKLTPIYSETSQLWKLLQSETGCMDSEPLTVEFRENPKALFDELEKRAEKKKSTAVVQAPGQSPSSAANTRFVEVEIDGDMQL